MHEGFIMDEQNFIKNWKNMSDTAVKNIEKKFSNTTWTHISACYSLTEEFMERFADHLNWNKGICVYQHLSEEFIERHHEKMNWNYISLHQVLSEEFIECHSEQVNWTYIERAQKLSLGFVLRNGRRFRSAHSYLRKYFRLKCTKGKGIFRLWVYANNSYSLAFFENCSLSDKPVGFLFKTLPTGLLFTHIL